MRISVVNLAIATMAILHGLIPSMGWFVASPNTRPPIMVALEYLEETPPSNDCLTDSDCESED